MTSGQAQVHMEVCGGNRPSQREKFYSKIDEPCGNECLTESETSLQDH